MKVFYYCVLAVFESGRAETGVYTELSPTTLWPAITQCLRGPDTAASLNAWLLTPGEGSVAAAIMTKSGREALARALRPRVDDEESTHVIIKALLEHHLTSASGRIAAIRRLRERVDGAGLRETKDRVDAVAATLIGLGLRV